MKLKVVLCEKLGTQNTHVAIMGNIMGVVGFIQNMLVWANKSSHVLYIFINCIVHCKLIGDKCAHCILILRFTLVANKQALCKLLRGTGS